MGGLGAFWAFEGGPPTFTCLSARGFWGRDLAGAVHHPYFQVPPGGGTSVHPLIPSSIFPSDSHHDDDGYPPFAAAAHRVLLLSARVDIVGDLFL